MSLGTVPPQAGVADDQRGESFWPRVVRLQAFQILLVLIVIIAVFATLAPISFANIGNARLIAQNASILAVLGVGMTFVIVTAGIDLSIGSVMVFSGVVAAKAMLAIGGEGWGTALAGVVVSVLVGLAWGIVNGVLIARARIPPLIVTLGSLGMALGLAQILTGGVDIRDVPSVLQDSVGYGNVLGQVPVLTLIALVVVVAGGVVLHVTRFGRYTYAIGSNEESARRVGIRVDRHLIKVYALSGLLAGFAGVLSLAQFGTTAIAGQSQTNLNVIAAVVIGGASLMGGRGSVINTLLGALVMGIIANIMNLAGVPGYHQQVYMGLIIVVAMLLQYGTGSLKH